jgi:Golgi SNAP receptor complex protein 2
MPTNPLPLSNHWLQSAHRKVLDVLNLLGVSNRVMSIAERRDTMDKIIVVGGMLVTLVVLYICWRAVS